MDLKKFRKDRGLGQKDIAEIFGCKQNHVSAIEGGTRNLTPLQIRLLIEKYGYEVVSKYADASEMPATVVNVSAPVISKNEAPVQAGNNNSMQSDKGLIEVMKKQSEHIEKQNEHISELIKQQQTLIAQQQQLITLLASQNK